VTAFLHRRLRERGHDPADFFIVSCNNERPYLEGLFPQPKVIDIRAEAIGATAADQLLKRIADPNMPHQNLTIEPEWNVD
jgi:LacI family transcriptional regulator